MIENGYSTLGDELDVAIEWIHNLILTNEEVGQKISKLKNTLSLKENSGWTPPNLEVEVDSHINMLLDMLEEELENSEVSKEDYENEVKKITSPEEKQSLMDEWSQPDIGLLYEMAVAAAELVAAILGKPTQSFNEFLSRSDDMFQESDGFLFSGKLSGFISGFLAEMNQSELVSLAIDVIKKINISKNIKKIGLEGKAEFESYSKHCDVLLVNLEELRTSLH